MRLVRTALLYGNAATQHIQLLPTQTAYTPTWFSKNNKLSDIILLLPGVGADLTARFEAVYSAPLLQGNKGLPARRDSLPALIHRRA
jgi:hypothetical protein